MALSLLSATCLPYHLSTIIRYDISSSQISFSSTSPKRTCANKFPRAIVHRAIDVYSLSILEKNILFIAYFYSSSIRGYNTERLLCTNSFSVECVPMMIIVILYDYSHLIKCLCTTTIIITSNNCHPTIVVHTDLA